jgi:hypothetical protein
MGAGSLSDLSGRAASFGKSGYSLAYQGWLGLVAISRESWFVLLRLVKAQFLD